MAKTIRNLATDEKLCEVAAFLVQGQLKEAEKQRDSLTREWQQARRLWDCKSISEVFPDDEIKHVPEPFNRAETIVPRVYSGVFGVGNWFSVAAANRDWVKSENAVKEVILWECMQGDWRFYSDQEDGIRQMVIYGTVVYKNDWFARDVMSAERTIKRKDIEEDGVRYGKKEEAGELKLVESKIAYPRARPLDLQRVFLDRYCDSITDCRYIGDQFVMTLDELEQRGKSGKNGAPAWVNIENYRQELQAAHEKKHPGQTADRPLTQVFPIEMWTWMDINGKVEPVAIVIGEQLTKNQVLSITRNTFPGGARPYQVGRYIKRPGEMYGVGAIIPVRGTSQDLDEWRTMHMRHAELALSPPLIADDQSMLPSRILMYPGRVLHSPLGAKGIAPVNIPVNPTAYQMESIFRNDIAQTARAPDVWAGQSEGGRQTAFEISRQLQESSLSLGRIVRRYSTEVLKPMLRNFLALNHMYLEEKIRIRKLGERAFGAHEPFREISPTDIQAQFDFEILDISEVAMVGNATQQWVAFLQATPQAMWGVIRWDRVFRDFLKSMGRDAPEEYVHMQPDAEDLLSAGQEHDVLSAEHKPPVLPQHNHLAHIAQHTMFKSTPQYAEWTVQQRAMLDSHMSDHLAQAGRQMEQSLQQAASMGLGAPPPMQQPGASPRAAPVNETGQLQQMAGQNQGR